jgi:hypothetical protein
MAKDTVITSEQIAAVKKRLRKLPVKNTDKNREKAMELLATDFQKAMRKGYTLKDIQRFLAEEGLAVPTYLLKKQTTREGKTPPRKAAATSVTANVESPTQQTFEQTTLMENIEVLPVKTAMENLEKITGEHEAKPAHAIIIKPDTPDTEL